MISKETLPQAYRERMTAIEIDPLTALMGQAEITEAYKQATGEEDAPPFSRGGYGAGRMVSSLASSASRNTRAYTSLMCVWVVPFS